MTLYRLYLESVDYRSTTMVHVLDLLGCVAVGPSTEAALDATPEAVNAFRRFLYRIGERVELDDAVDWEVAEHVTDGDRLGYGSPTVLFGPDRRPLRRDQTLQLQERHRRLHDEVARWAPLRSTPMPELSLARHQETARGALLHGSGSAQSLPQSVGIATASAPVAQRMASHALRLRLEHDWMLLVELSRLPYGPRL